MIEIRSLSKKFSDHWAVKDTSWVAQSDRALGLLGPNGAGKSTTMKIMTGLMCPTEGQVLIDGMDIRTDPIGAKSKIGYLPESPAIYEDLKVIDNLRFVCGLKSVAPQSVEGQVDAAIEKLRLNEMAYKPARILSKGFKQRLGIAQALVGDPSVLILDEPSVGLDPQQVFELRNIIKGLKKDHTIILSTHVLSEVQQICDDVVILDRGRVKSQGSLNELLKTKGHLRRISIQLREEDQALLDTIKSLSNVHQASYSSERVLQILVESDKDVDPSQFIDTILKSGNGVLGVSQESQQLEDVFIEVTQ